MVQSRVVHRAVKLSRSSFHQAKRGKLHAGSKIEFTTEDDGALHIGTVRQFSRTTMHLPTWLIFGSDDETGRDFGMLCEANNGKGSAMLPDDHQLAKAS